MSLKSVITALFKKSEIKADSSEGMEFKNMLFQWIDKLEKYAQPPKEITALNFGLFESDKSKYKYLLLKNVEISNLKWDEVLQTVQGHLKEFINEHPYYSLFKNRIVATGFDDGDLIIIKKL